MYGRQRIKKFCFCTHFSVKCCETKFAIDDRSREETLQETLMPILVCGSTPIGCVVGRCNGTIERSCDRVAHIVYQVGSYDNAERPTKFA